MTLKICLSALLCLFGLYKYSRGVKMLRKYKQLDKEHRKLLKDYLDLRVNTSGNLLAKARVIRQSDTFIPALCVVRGDDNNPEIIKRIYYQPQDETYIRNYCEDLADKINEEP